MSGPPLPKAAKPVWAKQLTRLPCLVVCGKFQFVYTPTTTSSNVLLGRGSEEAFNERLRATQLTRLPCLVVCVKFQFVYTTTTSSNVLLGRGSEEAFNERLGVSNVFPSAA